jgi:putative GTP pyrophosphokinase
VDRTELERVYRDELRPIYVSLAARVNTLLGELAATEGIDVAQIEHRAKTVESVLDKHDRKPYEDPLRDIKDFAGVRVITYYNDDNVRVADLIRREFEVDPDHSSNKVTELSVTEFGYRSLHLVAALSEPRKSLSEWNRFVDFSVEIQIRSVLQHAWASISHKLDYKATSEAPIELRRQLFRLSALLELADEDFASLRDRSRELAVQYRQEVDRGELDIPLNLDSLTQFIKERVDLRYWAEIGQKAGMTWNEKGFNLLRANLEVSPFLSTLQVVGVSNIAEVQSLIEEVSAIESTALEWLREFLRIDKAQSSDEGTFEAVGIDVLMILVSFYRAENIPPAFDWNDIWNDGTEAALKTVVKNLANNT